MDNSIGRNYEQVFARYIGGTVQPASGAGPHAKLDVKVEGCDRVWLGDVKAALVDPSQIAFKAADWNNTVALARLHEAEPYMPLAFLNDFLVAVWQKVIKETTVTYLVEESLHKTCRLTEKHLKLCRETILIWEPVPAYRIALISKENFKGRVAGKCLV